jgi:hypothetical protein
MIDGLGIGLRRYLRFEGFLKRRGPVDVLV